MTHRLDNVLSRWCDRWRRRDVVGLVDLYRHDAALQWMPNMTRSDWGTVGLTAIFRGHLDNASSAEARFGRVVGSDDGMCGAPFSLCVDGVVYEGWAFFRLSPSGSIEVDRRYAGSFFEPLSE